MNILKTAVFFFAISILFSCNKKTADAAVASDSIETAAATQTPPPNRRGQRGGQNPEARKKRMETMLAQLNLSEAQKVKFHEISAKYQEQRKTIFENSNGDRESMRAEMQKMRAAEEEELKGIMTAEQFEKYIEIQETQRKNRRGRRGGNGPRN